MSQLKGWRLLTEQAVVGYFTGRMEFGPRALGHRSILGDPRDPQHAVGDELKNQAARVISSLCADCNG